MISRIKRIRDLGLFRKFDWTGDLEDFRRFILIYGWNGSGKTTLSKLFTALESGRSSEFGSLEYEVATDSRSWKQGESCTEKVRVFNRDYVLANVERIGGPNAIFILGEENKKLLDQIDRDQEELTRRNEKLSAGKEELQRLKDRRGELFTDVARTISTNVSGESTRNYRRPNAESDYQIVATLQSLDDDALSACRATVGQRQLDLLPRLPNNPNLVAELNQMETLVRKTLETEVVAVPIQRLAENVDIANWVERGVQLHKEHKSVKCEYCANTIAHDRTSALEAHYNEADAKLKAEISDLITTAQGFADSIRSVKARESSNLYEELQGNYKAATKELDAAQSDLLGQLDEIVNRLEEKRTKTGEKMELLSTIEASRLLKAISKVNEIVDEHNKKTSKFEEEKNEARAALKFHYLNEIKVPVSEVDAQILKQEASIKLVQAGDPEKEEVGLVELRSRIEESKATMSSSHKACFQLNDKLARFLGRDEIVFEVSGEGYVIKRNGILAENLSEGEKTAIAFVYFIVHLTDQDFNVSEGIVVIDDPVSSLDSNSLFQAFAFMKDSVADAKQVFVLTHNFEFMRLVRNWLRHVKKAERSFYMIKNGQDGKLRTAYLAPLDRLLMEYESEYHYLFSLLIAFGEDDTLEAIYLFPNIGRKILETFLAFKVPTLENMDDKMKQLDFPEVEKSAILRFVNIHSHANRGDGVMGFDPALIGGGQQAIQSLLALIEKLDKAHYDSMVKLCESGS